MLLWKKGGMKSYCLKSKFLKMKKIFILAFFGIATIISSYSFKSPLKEPNPPVGNTGAPTQSRTCNRSGCHFDFGLNTAGGSITATGLPIGSYVPGQVYNFSVTISNASPMQIWGFAIKAVISGTGTALGTFSTTNPGTNVNTNELRNSSAAVFTGTSYTYTNLKWTAPATGTSLVSFYMTGVAGDGDGSEFGDYVYSSIILNITLPVTMGEIKGKLIDNTAIIDWSTYTESGNTNFDLERSTDGRNFDVLKTITGSGISSSIKNYKWIDTDLPKNEKILFYRLKVTDQSGKFEYSNVVSLKPSVTTYVENIYPTLLTGGELVSVKMVSNSAQEAAITIFSSAGKKIAVQVQTLRKGGNDFSINGFTKVGSGVYFLRIKTDNFSVTKKIIVQ
jgi:hypothetical protein